MIDLRPNHFVTANYGRARQPIPGRKRLSHYPNRIRWWQKFPASGLHNPARSYDLRKSANRYDRTWARISETHGLAKREVSRFSNQIAQLCNDTTAICEGTQTSSIGMVSNTDREHWGAIEPALNFCLAGALTYSIP